jgi:hypothetical protein
VPGSVVTSMSCTEPSSSGGCPSQCITCTWPDHQSN